MEDEHEKVNFFIPMVDMMVSAVFIFIIIVMVLVLMIKTPSESDKPTEEPVSTAAGGSVRAKSALIEDLALNQSSQEILVDDITRNLLKQQGVESIFDADNQKLEIKLKKPIKEN